METPVNRIGISGSYGGMNLGDEAILHSIVTQLRARLPVHITVFGRNPEDTLRHHQVEAAVAPGEMTRDEAREAVRNLDLFVLGGGGILYDGGAEAYLREVALAIEERIPVMVYAISAGPLNTRAAREDVSRCLSQVDVVTVRDRQGLRLLEEIGVHRAIEVTADPALLLEPEPLADDVLTREGLEGRRRLIRFSVREPGPAAPNMDVEHYHALLANAADFMVERLDADVVFVPMERKVMDTQQSHAVVARMRCAPRASVLKGDYTARQVLALMKHFDFAVGMRLHFLIFSALQSVPFVALPYASKVRGFIEDLEIGVPPIEAVSEGQLLAWIDRSWDRQDAIRSKIERLLPGLQARARRTNDILVNLLRERAGRPAEC